MSVSPQEISRQWRLRWSSDGPFDGPTVDDFSERWVRFHVLPHSKRYPETEQEYQMILERHNKILNELNPDENILLITRQWSNRSDDPELNTNKLDPKAVLWRTKFESPDETDPEFFTYGYYYVSERPWNSGAVDTILRKVADDSINGVFIAPLDVRWLYHPYDGGADIFCESSEQRDELKAKHVDWLSAHPRGL